MSDPGAPDERASARRQLMAREVAGDVSDEKPSTVNDFRTKTVVLDTTCNDQASSFKIDVSVRPSQVKV
jgi:hypothetical protein